MPEFNIGMYEYSASPNGSNSYYLFGDRLTKKSNVIKRYDRMLHRSLYKIFHEHSSSSSSSSQFKKFRRDPLQSADWKSMIEPILEHEPALSKHFSKEELGKLPLLWISVLAGYEKSAELLVRSGTDVNELFGRHDPQVIDEKWTVLHVLLQMDPLLSPENERLIRLVAEHGADLKARDYMGQTVLHYAVEKSRVQMTEMLLEKGADVEATNDEGMTPLLVAAGSQKANELVPLLVKHGADIFTKDHQGTNLLHRFGLYPFQEHAAELARDFIEKGVSLDDKGLNQMQPIHTAAAHRIPELVNLYLDHGANVNALTVYGESPLHLACQPKNTRVMKTLLKRGAKVDLRTIESHGSRTPLLAICKNASSLSFPSYEFLIVIRILLCAGADVHAEDSDGNTPLALISSSRRNVEQPGIWVIMKVLALKKARQPSIELKDKGIIERQPKLRNYYRDCIEEIDRMKSTRFIETCSFFKLLTESYRQIAELMRNPNFETQFEKYDFDDEFPIYAKDIRQAFEHAQRRYRAMIKQENVINEAFYNMLPYVVVRRMAAIYNDVSMVEVMLDIR